MNDRLLTKREVGERLGISKPTVQRLIARGDLEVVRVSERAVRISEGAVRSLVERRTERSGR
jgi:excisionase family DNA binding protein